MTSEPTYRLITGDEARKLGEGTRKAPVTMAVEKLNANGKIYWTFDEVADRYGQHRETMRRLCKAEDDDGNPKVKAPSAAVQMGKLNVYLFTKEDLEELDHYFERKGKPVTK